MMFVCGIFFTYGAIFGSLAFAMQMQHAIGVAYFLAFFHRLLYKALRNNKKKFLKVKVFRIIL